MANTLKDYIGVGIFYLVLALIILGMTYQNNKIDSHFKELNIKTITTY